MSWQIVPRVLGGRLQSAEAGPSKRVMQAMVQMTRFDIETGQRACEQG
ncbi:hypothetical protein [Caldimonas brevitalea]|uniref:Uncharacterized protein n=1 Tax=Caldimonas brevitalea TaxID=413882 RepID=A0A0G3BLV2_9BURK|nr:hypothetical protein [Caldimonas brevitalea]AKJ27540.1 hypothetical protein AAW51_0849 [Caldimonas brevitalea]